MLRRSVAFFAGSDLRGPLDNLLATLDNKTGFFAESCLFCGSALQGPLDNLLATLDNKAGFCVGSYLQGPLDNLLATLDNKVVVAEVGGLFVGSPFGQFAGDT